MLYSQFFKSKSLRNFILILGLLAFLFIKIYYIPIPFFWDESWVYGPAVSEMGLTIPSLLPGSIDIDLSRGHPMLFHFLGGVWGKVFGISVTSLHVFALSISAILLLLYFKLLTPYLKHLKHFALLFLCFTGVFLAQSAMVLPEVLVSLFVLLSLFSFANNKHHQAILFASLCLLSKESGAVLFPVLGISYLILQLFTDTFSWKKSFLFLFKLILGVLPYLVFLMIQKMRFGWHFYPNHIDLQINTIAKFQAQFISAFEYVFYAQGRILLSIAALVSYIIYYKDNRLALYLLGVSLINIGIWLFFPMSTWMIFASYITILILSVLPFIKELKPIYKKRHLIYLTIFVFFAIYLVFTAMNFYSSRYILCLIPLSIFVCFTLLEKYAKHTATHILSLAMILISVVFAMKRGPISDVNQSFVDVGRAQKALFMYLEEENLYEEVFLAPFLVHESLKKVYAGHRSNTIPFKNVPYYPAPDQAFYNIISFEGELINSDHKKGREKELVKEFKSGKATYILEKYSAVKE